MAARTCAKCKEKFQISLEREQSGADFKVHKSEKFDMSAGKNKGKRKAAAPDEGLVHAARYNIQVYVHAQAAGHIALFEHKMKGYAPGDFQRAESEAFFEAFDKVIELENDERESLAVISVCRSDSQFLLWRKRAFERALNESEDHYQQYCADVDKKSQEHYSKALAIEAQSKDKRHHA